MRYAQKVAVASGCPVQVSVDASGFSLLQRSACTSGGFSVAVPHPARAAAFSGTTPSGVTVSAAVGLPIFSALGDASAGGTIGVSAGAVSRTITLVAATGFVASS
ncbi:MAG: hypothetical protein LC632_08885 [Xanthomonadaceae bacterium]|nr:hypothetical protein [Xanthomonadaceae bacterium]